MIARDTPSTVWTMAPRRYFGLYRVRLCIGRVSRSHLRTLCEPGGSETRVVLQHALGRGPVTEEVAIRLQGDRARQREREQQQRGDKQRAWTRWTGRGAHGRSGEMHRMSVRFKVS